MRLEEALEGRSLLRQKKVRACITYDHSESLTLIMHTFPHQQQLLQLFMKMNDAVQKVEALLSSSELPSDPMDTVKVLERLGVELNQLYFLFSKDRNLPMTIAMTSVNHNAGL